VDRLLSRPSQLCSTNPFYDSESIFCFFGKNFNSHINGIQVLGYERNLSGFINFVDFVYFKRPSCLSFSKDFFVFLFLKCISFNTKSNVKLDLISPVIQNEVFFDEPKKENFFNFLKWKIILRYSNFVHSARIHIFEHFMVTKGLDNFISTDLIVGARYPAILHSISSSKPANSDVVEFISRFEVSVAIVSRLEKVKMVDEAISAFVDSTASFSKSTCLVVMGYGSLEHDLIDKYNGFDNVYFHGIIDHRELFTTLSNFNFLISLVGGNSIVEAASVKVPSIAYGFHIMPEFVVDKYTGLLIDRYDFCQLVDAITLLANDTDLCNRYGENAYAVVNERFCDLNILHDIRRLERILYG